MSCDSSLRAHDRSIRVFVLQYRLNRSTGGFMKRRRDIIAHRN